MKNKKTYSFYKKFYAQHKIIAFQHQNLRKHFDKLVDDVLGEKYYNLGLDVYHTDKLCCEDIKEKAQSFWQKLFKKF